VLLTKLLFYAYCEGETCSRQIMRATYENIAYRVLCVDQHPDFRTVSDFRERHVAAFAAVFKDTVRLAKALGQAGYPLAGRGACGAGWEQDPGQCQQA
jgi:transposase